MGVPLNVIDYRCFWKAVSAMQKAEYQVNSTIIESYSAVFKDGACSLGCSLCECGLFQKIQICVV